MVIKFYTNCCGLNMPEDSVESKCFRIISIDSLIICQNKFYLQVYVDNCAYKIINTEMVDYLDDNLFKTD